VEALLKDDYGETQMNQQYCVSNNTNNLKEFALLYTIKKMIYTYREALKKFGNERQVLKAVKDKEIFLISRGFYSDNRGFDESYVAKKYPNAIFTGRSAFYHYGLTDTPPEVFEVATKIGSTRIKDKRITQTFQIECIFEKGKVKDEEINIYDLERTLIELFRFRKSYSYDYFKEVLNSYRRRADEIDFVKVARYLKDMTYGDRLLREIREAF
jgi:hypothetical protein